MNLSTYLRLAPWLRMSGTIRAVSVCLPDVLSAWAALCFSISITVIEIGCSIDLLYSGRYFEELLKWLATWIPIKDNSVCRVMETC